MSSNYNNNTSSSSSSRPSTSTTTPTTIEEQEQLMKDAVLALSAIAGAFLLLKALAASVTVYLALLPLAFVYGLNTCPPTSSFDAKQQLRMVFRGDHQLPPDHPQKPKSGFAQFMAEAKAAITSELATLPGYEVTMTSLAGAAIFATVTMTTADLECYWLGCNHRWYYWGSKKLSEDNNANVAVAGVSNNKEGVNVHKKAPESANIKFGKTNIKFDFGKKQE